MNKKEWQEFYGIYDVDMELIEESRRFGGMVIAVNNFKLNYDVIKYEMYKK